jgi:hypothetical protein
MSIKFSSENVRRRNRLEKPGVNRTREEEGVSKQMYI